MIDNNYDYDYDYRSNNNKVFYNFDRCSKCQGFRILMRTGGASRKYDRDRVGVVVATF